MAKIELSPGEVFEHYHSDASKTEALSGVIKLKIGGETRDLAVGETVSVPANTPHAVVNCGDTPAVVACWH